MKEINDKNVVETFLHLCRSGIKNFSSDHYK